MPMGGAIDSQTMIYIQPFNSLIVGIGSVPFLIQRSGPDSDRLPTASTCYNTLLLPEYMTVDKLQKKLETAIEHYHGFGLK